MDPTVLASLITGLLSLAGVMLSNLLSDRRREAAQKIAQAVTDERLEELTREVRLHNNFARRMPVVEEQIKILQHSLEKLEKGSGGEIQLTDGIARLIEREDVCAYHFTGQRFDCGSKVGYLKATVTMGLRHPEVKEDFRHFLSRINLTE